jgi:hypothetical protein
MGFLKELVRLKVSDRISLAFSAIALLFSTVGLYYQVFYVKDDVVASINMYVKGQPLAMEAVVDAVFINSGNRDALIMSCQPAVMERNSGQHQWTSLRGTVAPFDDTERVPRVIKPGGIEVVRCSGVFSVPQLFESASAYDAPERGDGRLRRVHFGVIVSAFDSTGRQWLPTYHLWTHYITRETTERGEGEPSIFRLFANGEDARYKDWSKLRPVP